MAAERILFCDWTHKLQLVFKINVLQLLGARQEDLDSQVSKPAFLSQEIT